MARAWADACAAEYAEADAAIEASRLANAPTHGRGAPGHDEGDHAEQEAETPKRSGANKSLYARVRVGEHLAFLESPPLRRGDALRLMQKNDFERELFEYLVLLEPDEIAAIWKFDQKSLAWLWSRQGRSTGSAIAPGVGLNRYTRPLKHAFKLVYERFQSNSMTEWGATNEDNAAQAYIDDLLPTVTRCFRRQRALGFVERNGFFVFRNQRIRVPDINADPTVELRLWGQLVRTFVSHHSSGTPANLLIC